MGGSKAENVAWALLDVSKQSVNTRDNVQLEMFEYPVDLRKGASTQSSSSASSSSASGGCGAASAASSPSSASSSGSSGSSGHHHHHHKQPLTPANVFLSVGLTLTRLEVSEHGGILEDEADEVVGSEGEGCAENDDDAPLDAESAPEVGSIAGAAPPPRAKVDKSPVKSPPPLPPRSASGLS